jgi:predicted methyltransferase
MRIAFLAALLAAAATVAPSMPAIAQQQAAADPAPDPALAPVLAHERRGADRARDAHRHPAETLAFFGVKPGMTVVDYLPAGGWYSRILVPYLGPQGRYIAMAPDLTGETNQYFLNSMGGLAEKFPTQAAGWNLGSEGAAISAFNVDGYPEALDGTVDIVLSFREMHNQLRFGWLHDDLMTMRRMLKPGGFVGLTDHRANEDAPFAARNGSTGYLRESDVIALMGVYGFELVGKSEINANPRDTKDYPGGVWTLAPGMRGVTDETRARIEAIGESDRMTLLFRKLD